MALELANVILYLACVVAVDGLLLVLLRRLRLADFIAHIVTGVFIGFLFGPGLGGVKLQLEPHDALELLSEQVISKGDSNGTLGKKLSQFQQLKFPDEAALTDSLRNALSDSQWAKISPKLPRRIQTAVTGSEQLLQLLAAVGVILFMMQLGFGLDLRLFASRLRRDLLIPLVVFVIANTLILSLYGYFIFGRDAFATAALVAAFLSINIGAVITPTPPSTPQLRRSLNGLLYLAATLDIAAVIMFAAIRPFFEFQNALEIPFSWQEILAWVLLLAYVPPLLMPRRAATFFGSVQQRLGESSVPLAALLILLFVFAALQVGMALPLLGIWCGMLLRTIMPHFMGLAGNRLFGWGSIFMMLPFVDAGRKLTASDSLTYASGLEGLVLLLALFAISMTSSSVLWQNRQQLRTYLIGTISRGELALLLFWCASLFMRIEPREISLVAIVVVGSSLFGRFAARWNVYHRSGEGFISN